MEPLQLRSMRDLLQRLENIESERSRAVLNVDILRQMALCVLGLGTPFLLSGPSGGGKSFLIKQLWSMLHAELDLAPILWLSLDDSVDSKVLLGSWVSAKELGSFEWQDGVLASAMKSGQWIVIEDVDQANSEVLAKLSELTTHRSLFVSERHVSVDAHANFALFGTVSRPSLKVVRAEQDVSSDIQLPPLLLGWHQGVCPLMTESAVNKVISVKFPELSGVSELLSNAYVAMVTSFHSLCRGERRLFLTQAKPGPCRSVNFSSFALGFKCLFAAKTFRNPSLTLTRSSGGTPTLSVKQSSAPSKFLPLPFKIRRWSLALPVS